MFENNLRRMILYFIIAELGVILIFIGIGENIMTTALIFIINDLLCIPTILCAANFVIRFFKEKEVSEMKNVFYNTRPVMFLSSIALFSVASLPFSLGYISKKYLHATDYFSKSHWISLVVDLVCGGIVLAICFKFIIFVFLKGFSFKQRTKSKSTKLNFKRSSSYIFALSSLYIGFLGVTLYFILMLGTSVVEIDDFLLNQVQHILIVGILFFAVRKYLALYSRDAYSVDPNILYLNLGRWFYERSLSRKSCFDKLISGINSRLIKIQSNLLACFKNINGVTNGLGWGITFAIALLVTILCLLK